MQRAAHVDPLISNVLHTASRQFSPWLLRVRVGATKKEVHVVITKQTTYAGVQRGYAKDTNKDGMLKP